MWNLKNDPRIMVGVVSLFSVATLAGCATTQQCNGVITEIDRNAPSRYGSYQEVNVAYTYNKTMYVEQYDCTADPTLFNQLKEGEHVIVYAVNGDIQGLVVGQLP